MPARLIPLSLFFLCSLPAFSQQIDYLPGRLIIEFNDEINAHKWANTQTELKTLHSLGPGYNIWLATFNHGTVNLNRLRRRLAHDPAVRFTQPDRPIRPRRVPNDPRYPELWRFNNSGQYDGTPGADLNIEPAWDVTTGGTTANGDEIVVAVLDDGTDLDHEDLLANLWTNDGEIPNNDIDDDNNGYVDDYYGFDSAANDGDPSAGSSDTHGTPVAGIIGAVGNNNLGVTGVNWGVKIMTVRNAFLNSESEVLQAYLYVLNQRNRYDISSGQQGAYVVATNASWGRAYGDVDDSPIWCNVYDDLGKAGILNVGATANADIDVDQAGDLPTNCPSDYLIGVTNLDTDGLRVPRAAYGSTSIDLGAHGQEVLTTDTNNGYRRFSGTSSATPHVTGAAALLYSAPCPAFAELLTADPAAAALYVKGILLRSATPNESLAGITVSGGQLNVGAAMQLLMADCSTCFAPTGFVVTPVPGTTSQLAITYNAIDRVDRITLRYRPLGAPDWMLVENPPLPYIIDSLPACTGYEFELVAACGNEALPAQRIEASTDGCCAIPDDFRVSAEANGLFTANWSQALAGVRYNIRYRPAADNAWRTRTSNSDRLTISDNFDPCTPYVFELRIDCDTAATGYGNRQTVTSLGCGACLEDSYCTPNGYDNTEEWIAGVNFANNFRNETGAEQGGYGDYTGADINMVRGGVYPITLTSGTEGFGASEAFRVYVDWNQDAVLSANEVVADLTSPDGNPVTFDLEIPADAPLLATRLRVVMNYIRVLGACNSGRSGEYEDYCLHIEEATACPAPARLFAGYEPASGHTTLSWNATAAAGNDYRIRYRMLDGGTWEEEDVSGIRYVVEDLNLCGSYEIELASYCDGEVGVSKVFRFSDICVGTNDPALADAAWSMSPNPTEGQVHIALRGGGELTRGWVFASDGRLVQRAVFSGQGALLDVSQLPAGLYLVQIITRSGERGLRRLIIR